MNEKPSRPSRRLRSTLDRVLVHDIKNMGFRLQLLLSNLKEHYDDPEFKRSVEELLRSTVDRIDGIVDRFSTGDEPVLIKVPVDLNGVVREVAEGETRRGLSVPPAVPGTRTLSLALGPIPQIWGDPYYLTDAVKSLIENALEAVPSEGKVLVRTFRDDTAKRPRVVVEIIDNGSGMTPEFVRDRLFKPFQTTKPDGVGLGLATASQIVQFHNGKFAVLTRPGGGTVVRIVFPAVPAGVPATRPSHPTPGATPPETE
ncbi:MAG TPA: ATP-binding protein [Thermoanaerobaculia bacterium]